MRELFSIRTHLGSIALVEEQQHQAFHDRGAAAGEFLKLQDLQESAVTAGGLAVDEVDPLVVDRERRRGSGMNTNVIWCDITGFTFALQSAARPDRAYRESLCTI
jgi:hypothetical protein